MTDVTDWPVVEAKWRPSREGHTVVWVVLHSMEVPLRAGVAASVGRYFADCPVYASTHVGADPGGIVRYLPDDVGCYGAEHNSNRMGWHVEQAGYAQYGAEWHSPEGLATIGNAADAAAYACRRFGVPARALPDREVAALTPGIVTHAQLVRVFRVAGGHWDPGPGYPVDLLVGRVRELLGQSALVPVADPARAGNRFRDFPVVSRGTRDDVARVAATALDPPPVERAVPVLTAQMWLNRVMRTTLVGDGHFGPLTEAAVRHFQQWWRDQGVDLAVDEVCGPLTWSQLDTVADIQGR